ncbi:MAG: zinc ribbon domain-containing protein [Kiritimatiellae bacterium]|nr:zinc ribbon domain-containing protein [Kiritimatiellia bacterium]
MPLYEYKCRKCGAEAELLVRESDPRPRCPKCGSSALMRQYSTFTAAVRTGSPSGCAGGACPLPSSPCASGGCAGGTCPLG